MSDNATFVRVVIGTGAVVVLGFASLLCCAGGAGWFGSGAFVKFGIGTDLEDYVGWVERSDLGPADKAEVLGRLENIQDEVRTGEIAVPFVAWVDIDDAIEDLISDGQIPPNELAQLHDQLNRIEAY